MDNNNSMKSVFIGWLALAVAFVCGKKYGYGKCVSEVKDIVLKQLIDEKKEEKGS